MPVYIYRAKKSSGEFEEGQIEASNREEVLTRIDSLGLFPISVEEKTFPFKFSSKVSLKELVEFTHQLSILINSGSSLLTSLNTLVLEGECGSLKPIILNIVNQIREGEDFSSALKKYPHIFSQLYISLVKVGETSGTLGENLKRLAEFLEEEMDFKTNIISILIYPSLIVGVGILTIFVLLKFVVPKLVEIFEEIGQTLPSLTFHIINISRFVSQYWLFILSFIFLIFFTIRQYLQRPSNKLKWDRLKLRIPLVGELLKRIEVCRFASVLSILLKNGIPIDSSLKVLNFTISNTFFKEEIAKLEADIKEGSSLNEAMKQRKLFSPSFINVVTVGEESGKLDSVLENLSNDYKKDINRKIKTLMGLLEPCLILCVGLIVGFVVLSMLLPIFEMDFNF